MLERLKSRKLWVTIFTQILIVLVVGVFEIPEERATEIIQWVVSVAATYILGQSYIDSKTEPAVAVRKKRVLPRPPVEPEQDEPTEDQAG